MLSVSVWHRNSSISLFLPCLCHILQLFCCQLSHCFTIHAGGLVNSLLYSQRLVQVGKCNPMFCTGFYDQQGEVRILRRAGKCDKTTRFEKVIPVVENRGKIGKKHDRIRTINCIKLICLSLIRFCIRFNQLNIR